jgi:protein-S-isoprenylcysteine O-methyltransferase Ste14
MYLLASLIAMAGLHRLFPVAIVLHPPVTWGGVVFVGAGLALAAVAAVRFWRRGTSVHPFHPPTALVTDGPYRMTRNAMYLGLVIVLLGVAIWLGSVTPVLVIPAFMWAIQRRFIEPEEHRLADAFGPAYLEYRRRVRRWL